jgi:D-alanyl-D-alanine carboxypeptidase (penicillin-binding protein 5/6)
MCDWLMALSKLGFKTRLERWLELIGIGLILIFLATTTSLANSLPATSSKQWVLQQWLPNGTAVMLAGQAEQLPTHPASITKLLTAYVTLQAVAKGPLSLGSELTVSQAAQAQDGTRVGYRAGERVTIQDALQGMLAISGNDAAWALGEAVGGTMEGFVRQMNVTSAALGLSRSQWHNPHGLTQDGHVSSAGDLARLSHALWRDFPQVRPWLGVKTYTWHGVTQSNRNSLLWRVATVDGLKTGHTDAAGYNLAATSLWPVTVGQDRYDWRLTSVVLGAASANERANDSAALLNWGRQAFVPWRLYASGESVGTVKVTGAIGAHSALTPAAVWAVLASAQTASGLRFELLPLPTATAPVAAGAVIGRLEVYDGQTLLASSEAVSATPIERAAWYARVWHWLKSVF